MIAPFEMEEPLPSANSTALTLFDQGELSPLGDLEDATIVDTSPSQCVAWIRGRIIDSTAHSLFASRIRADGLFGEHLGLWRQASRIKSLVRSPSSSVSDFAAWTRGFSVSSADVVASRRFGSPTNATPLVPWWVGGDVIRADGSKLREAIEAISVDVDAVHSDASPIREIINRYSGVAVNTDDLLSALLSARVSDDSFSATLWEIAILADEPDLRRWRVVLAKLLSADGPRLRYLAADAVSKATGEWAKRLLLDRLAHEHNKSVLSLLKAVSG